jgi:enterochelin esterase-like enzyme
MRVGIHPFIVVALCLTFSTILAASGCAQDQRTMLSHHLVRIQMESDALRGNLVGDPATREMLVLLPPSYFRSRITKYPTVYLLHGLGERMSGHLGGWNLFTKAFELMKTKALPEIILVAVDGTTVFGGSYYTNSPTIGNFEVFVARDVVGHIDSVYRTIADRQHRGVAGFSMGGFGAIKIAMKYPDIFGSVGSLSGSPLSMRFRKPIYKKALRNHPAPVSLKELTEQVTFDSDWSLAAAYAKASAFSSNPSRPPLFLDLPFGHGASEDRDTVWQKWLAVDPLTSIAFNRDNLGTLDQIYIDHGDDELTLGTEDFVRELVRYGIGCTYYIFRGDHADELLLRHLRMLRFLSIRWSAGE